MTLIVETDMCAVDAVQLLIGCTFGKGNLIHRDCMRSARSLSGVPLGPNGPGGRRKESGSAL